MYIYTQVREERRKSKKRIRCRNTVETDFIIIFTHTHIYELIYRV